MSLKLPENEARVSALIQEAKTTGVVYDVLRDYGIGDLNGDEGMTATLSAIGRITRQGDPQRIPLIRPPRFNRQERCGARHRL